MKKETEKEREIYAIGSPSIRKLSKNEQEVFYSMLLLYVIDFYKKNNNIDK